MKRRVYLLVCFVLCLFLDTAVFPAWNLFSLIPYTMLALTLAVCRVFDLQEAMIVAGAGGLLEDLLCQSFLGFSSALYLLAAAALYAVQRKNVLKPLAGFFIFTGLAFLTELLRALCSLALGGRFSLLPSLAYGAFPRALLTALWALLLARFFRPLLKGQVDAA